MRSPMAAVSIARKWRSYRYLPRDAVYSRTERRLLLTNIL
jgi:hypothetical protein